MSSICGLLYLDARPAERAAVQRMVHVLSHWGPDASGLWTGGPVGLGHLMLRTTPECLDEQQPWVSPDEQLVVTADARIDNRQELFDALGTPPAARSMPDSRLIAHAYQKWGTRCPEFLIGDFAFSIWDAREQRLFCARDFIGIRPFYYFQDHARFLFATEIKGIFSQPEIPHTLNERALMEFLLRARGEPGTSLYEHVSTLPPAHALVVSRDRSHLYRYWKPDPGREIRLASPNDYVAAYRDLMQQAVESRSRTVSPIVSTLSDGIDSSTITWFARQAAKTRKIPAFALSWADIAEKEAQEPGQRRYSFLNASPMEHRYVYTDLGRMFKPSGRLFDFHDGPIRDIRFDVMVDTFQAAANCEARVILFGIGGDEVATSHGLDYLLGVLFRGRLDLLLSEVRAQSRVAGGSMPGIILGEIIGPLLRSTPWRLGLASARYGLPLSLEDSAARPEFLRRLSIVTGARGPDVPTRLAFRNPVRANQLALLFSGELQRTMETRYAAASLFRLECAFPMLDRRLVEFCLALPPEQHRSGGWARRIVRQAMTHDLPHELIWRVSKDSPPFEYGSHYASNEGLIRDEMKRWRSNDAIAQYIDIEKLEKILDARLTRNVTTGGHLERGFLLAAYLDWSTRSGR